MTTSPERRAVISGIAQSAVGRKLGRDELDLTIEASMAAIADAGLRVSDIDGLATYPGNVGGNSGDYQESPMANGPPPGGVVPAGCNSGAPLSNQEKALEFMLFDLTSCLAPPGGGADGGIGIPQ